ncbi:autotransporter-associated beta strand protein, partial [Ancylobacter polymorphus]
FASARDITLTGGGTVSTDTATTLTLSGVLTGDGGLTKTGAGTLILSGSNDYTDGTTVSAGTLQIGADSNLGDEEGDLTLNGATLATTATFASGRGVTLSGGGTFSTDSATTLTLSGVLTGDGGLTKTGAGTLILSGTNDYTGGTTVSAGTLQVDGSVAGAASVASGATLQGSGSLAGTVSVADGGTLAGAQGSGLTLGGLVLAASSTVEVTLGASSAGGVFTVSGDVTLDGTLNVTQATGFGAGIYNVISYSGSLTDNGLSVASLGSDYVGGVQTSVAGQVNLVVEDTDAAIQFWNGSTTTATQTVVGGDGSWTAGGTTNWTNASGTIPQAWKGGFAVFQGIAGTVSVDDADGEVGTGGMQFVTSGYVVSGDALTLSGSAGDMVTLRVGDGTLAGADTVATIASTLTGAAGLEKTDYGTLVLSGTNTHEGGTTVTAGTLSISADAALGNASGGLTFNGGTLATTATFGSARTVTLTGDGTFDTATATTLTLSGTITGDGSLTKSGAGTLVLSGTNDYTGGTIVSAGTLSIAADAALGNASGDLTLNGATLAT